MLVNTQTYHGFGRILQYQGGRDSGNAYIYEGWFINGLAQGIGRKIYQDGMIYEGHFRFGLENGEGERDFVVTHAENELEKVHVQEKGTFAFGIFSKEH